MMSRTCAFTVAARLGVNPCSTVRQVDRRSWLSTLPLHRPVLPRRVWQAHVRKLPKKPKIEKPKPDDKPWPRNVLIAGGVAAGVLVPYFGVWLITSNPTLRSVFAPVLPMDRLRKHFGVLEWDAQSYADKDDEIPEGYYQFPMEMSFSTRQQQARIEEWEKQTVTANIYILGDSQVQETKQVPASTAANPQNLVKLVGATVDGNSRVAVDFVDSPSGDGTASEMSAFDEKLQENIPNQDLLHRMHTFSTWHYTPAMGRNDEKPSQKTSDVDIQRMRLEYTVEKLQKDLRDPNCTRDMDEMQAELKQAKRDLSRIKWKRRLGF